MRAMELTTILNLSTTIGDSSTIIPASAPTRKASKCTCGRGPDRRRSAPGATGRPRVTITFPSGASSSSILNLCHHHRGFVYHHPRFGPDQKSVEVHVRPRAGSAAVCSGCHRPAPGYDHLPERRFEFIPFWGILVFFLYSMWHVQCRNCGVVVTPEAKSQRGC